MHSCQKLPTEITGRIFLALENPSDLLHVALTCKSFYAMIVPTYHLDLASISCSESETSRNFWQKLCASPHYASMIRQLEICDKGEFEELSYRRRYCGRRIDEDFVALSSGSPLPAMAASSRQELFSQSLSYMDGLKSISILKRHSNEENDILLPQMSKYFSNTLKTLHVHYGHFVLSEGSIPQYKSSDCSFHNLTSLSIQFGFNGRVPKSFDSFLNSVASSCHTLVNFALQLTSYEPFSCTQLVKNATWPLLEKLTFVGPLKFFDNDTSQEESTDLWLSFFERHARLERLYLSRLRDTDGFMERMLAELGRRLPDALPSLQSLRSDCPIPSKLLPGLVHISNNFVSPADYSWARSLRNCNLGETKLDCIEAIVRNVPQLERLSLVFEVPEDFAEHFECFWDGLPALVTELQNLTHLEIYMENSDFEDTCRGEDLISYLPRLSYVHVWSDTFESEWLGITADPDDPDSRQVTSLEDSPDQSFRSEFWGGFFAGPTMELEG